MLFTKIARVAYAQRVALIHAKQPTHLDNTPLAELDSYQAQRKAGHNEYTCIGGNNISILDPLSVSFVMKTKDQESSSYLIAEDDDIYPAWAIAVNRRITIPRAKSIFSDQWYCFKARGLWSLI